MRTIPEGVTTTRVEGPDIASAVATAATKLGVRSEYVHYLLDKTHFINQDTGSRISRSTVAIVGWAGDAPRSEAITVTSHSRGENADASRETHRADRGSSYGDRREQRSDRGPRHSGEHKASRSRSPRDGFDDRRERRSGSERRLKGPEDGTTTASERVQTWFQTLLGHLGIEGEVTATGGETRVHVRVLTHGKAGRLIGRRGATLGSIRHILSLMLAEYGDLTIDVDVDDDNPPADSESRRDSRRDTKPKERGSSTESVGHFPPEKLRELAQRAAQKATETGKVITINLDLNAHDRRLVHVEVGEKDGVMTQSVEKDGKKVIQVIPENAE